jgi:hypothetical protein
LRYYLPEGNQQEEPLARRKLERRGDRLLDLFTANKEIEIDLE